MSASNDKIIKGQFFTKEQLWLKSQIKEFIANSGCNIAYDPFAGAGDLLRCSHIYGIDKIRGLDIDNSLGWDINDSLINIPHIDNAVIITNPPYLSNYSASRKNLINSVSKYFSTTDYDDLYLLALDKMLEAQKYVVAIIPETFINSGYRQKKRLSSITVLEENPFFDTDAPICVACFDGTVKNESEIMIYKNDELMFSLEKMNDMRLSPKNNLEVKFNDIGGWLGLRAVDTTNPENMIHFDYKDNFDYDWNKGIKESSRLLSLIDIAVPNGEKQRYIDKCNNELEKLRKRTGDIILSPFKGNMKNGQRRRRLDFYTARAIMETAYDSLFGTERTENNEQFRLF